MNIKLFVLCISMKIINSKIVLNLNVEDNNNLTINYSGIEVHVVTDDDIASFDITEDNLQEALYKHYGRRPDRVYLKSPTPWGDLYKTYKWEQVSRVLSIKSARFTAINIRPVIVMTQDFENFSKKPIKVNTGISHSVKNTLTTSWSRQKAVTVSQEIEYDVNIIFAKMSGSTGFSYTTNWGISKEVTETKTIGTTSGVETELQPGQAVTAVLSTNTGYFEVEVTHRTSLRGNIAVNFKKAYNGHHFWGPPVQNVMKSGGLENEIITLETIKLGFYMNATLKVFDKSTGLPL